MKTPTKREPTAPSRTDQTELEKLRWIALRARGLVNQLKMIHDHPAYKSVWLSYANHGVIYNGPKYNKHLEELEQSLNGEPLPKISEASTVAGEGKDL